MHELVRQVVEEVLRRVSVPEAKSFTLILAEESPALRDQLRELFGPDAGLQWLDERDALAKPDRCIVPVLSCADMADLALGRAGNRVAEAILENLLSGRPVEVLELEYTRYLETAPAALIQLYESYEKTLASFGMNRFKAPAPESLRLRERLITAACVRRAAEQGVRSLLVPAGSVITPLARDAANELRIGLVREP